MSALGRTPAGGCSWCGPKASADAGGQPSPEESAARLGQARWLLAELLGAMVRVGSSGGLWGGDAAGRIDLEQWKELVRRADKSVEIEIAARMSGGGAK